MKSYKLFWILVLFLNFAFCATIQEKEKHSEIDKNDPEYIYKKATISMNYNLVDEAIKYLKEALIQDPTHFPSCYLLGVAYLKKGNLIEARKAFEKSVELDPESADAHSYLATVYQNLKLLEEAEEELKKVLELDNSFNSNFSLAKIYYEQEKFDESLIHLSEAIRKNNQSAPAYNLQGVIFNKLGRYPEAISSFQSALKIDSSDLVAGVNLGVAYINNREYDKARRLLTKILEITQDQTLKDKINEYLKAIKDKLL